MSQNYGPNLLEKFWAENVYGSLDKWIRLYNTIDTVVVGQFVGTKALASVGGSSSQMINLVVGFFTGLSSGASVIIAQYYGAKDEEFVRKGIHNAYAIAAAGGIFLSIVGIALAPAMLRMMNTPSEIVADSTLYLRVYFSGLLFTFVYNIGSSILRAIGDSRTPLYILIACCIVNIVLDLIFVVVFHEGVFGVALATLLAQAFSAVLVTWKLMKSKGMLQLKISKIRFYKSALISQIKLGIPTGIESILFAITNIAIQASLKFFRDGYDSGMVGLWKAGRNFLDDQFGFWHFHYYFCRAEFWRG